MSRTMLVVAALSIIILSYMFVSFRNKIKHLGKCHFRFGSVMNPYLLPVACFGLLIYGATTELLQHYLKMQEWYADPQFFYIYRSYVIFNIIALFLYILYAIILVFLVFRRKAIYEKGFLAPYRVIFWDKVQTYSILRSKEEIDRYYPHLDPKNLFSLLVLKHEYSRFGRDAMFEENWFILHKDVDKLEGYLQKYLPGKEIGPGVLQYLSSK